MNTNVKKNTLKHPNKNKYPTHFTHKNKDPAPNKKTLQK